MRAMGNSAHRLAWVTVVTAAVALGACSTTPSNHVDWDGTHDFGVPGAVLETHGDVPYYPACGNEVLTWEGEDYFPYNPADIDDFPDPTAMETRASALGATAPLAWVRMSVPLPSVVPPGPGDDVGTLVIYEGGHAFWESENGALSTWLTTAELQYNWVC